MRRDHRIVLVVTDFPSPSETFISAKALGLIEAGVDLRIACTRSDDINWQRLTPSERKRLSGRVKTAWPRRPRALALFCLPLALAHCLVGNPRGTARYLRRSWKQHGWRCLRQLYRDANIVALAPDLIHFEFGSLAAERPELGHRLGSKLTSSLRGYDLVQSGQDDADFYTTTWSALDAVHVLGDHLRHLAGERGLPASMPVYDIPPALDPDLFAPSLAARGGSRDAQVASAAGSDARSRDAGNAGTLSRSGNAADGPTPPQDGRADFHHGLPATGSSSTLRLLSVGRAHWTKGYDYALMAAHLLDRRGVDFRYRIIGGGAGLEALYLARHQLGLEKRVEILGTLPPDDVRRELDDSDIFVHAAVTEGFGNAVLEAQAMARPVVTTDAGGLPENVEPGQTALVVPRRDPTALADSIASLAGDPARRREMGRRGRQRIEEIFSLDRQIATFQSMYSEVLARK